MTACTVSRKALAAGESTEKTLMSHAVLLSQVCLLVRDFYWELDWLSTLRFFDIDTRWECRRWTSPAASALPLTERGGCFAVSREALAAGESTEKTLMSHAVLLS
jgi:hypothetical protein